MSAVLELRASSMPLAFKCGGSVRLPLVRVREEQEAANLGTATHKALQPLAEGKGIDWDGITEIADRYAVDFAELRMLVASGSKLWHKVRASFPGAITEADLAIEIPWANLTGHVDLIAISGDVARAADWKSGRKDSDYSEQMRAYGSLVLLSYPQLREITVTILWLRDEEIENYTMTRADAVAWVARLEVEVVRWDEVFRTGPHCQYCPRSHECEAANAMVRRDVAALADKALVARAECEIELMSPAEVVSLYEKASLVENFAGRVRDAIKAHVVKAGDVVVKTGDVVVNRLTLEREARREIDPEKAWPVLENAGFTDADFARSMTLRISKIQDIVAERAGRGKGAAAKRKIEAELDEAGAISIREIQKLRLKRG